MAEANRRRRASGRDRRRFLTGIGVAGCLGIMVALFLFVSQSEVFSIRRVSLPVLRHVSQKEMESAVSLARGSNIFRVSTSAIERRLNELPYVRRAEVYRRFPDALEVTVEEYLPVARMQARDARQWVVSLEGRVLGQAKDPVGDLPLLVPEIELWPRLRGILPSVLVRALSVAPFLQEGGLGSSQHKVKRTLVDSTGRLTLVLNSGSEVRLGPPVRLNEKFKVAASIIDWYSREGRSLAYVDVSDPSRVVAKTRSP